MQDLGNAIDVLYTTTSDVERRETMARLTAFFQTSESWASLLNLFAVALASTTGSPTEQKRRQRICFFAGNALYNKIKKETLSVEAGNELTKKIYELMVAQSMASGSVILRDPRAELMGTATTRRLVLCLATLAFQDDARLHDYLQHAVILLSSSDAHASFLALELLLAVANPLNEDQDPESESDARGPEWLSPQIRQISPQVLVALETFVKSLPNNGESNNALLLETIRAWLIALGSSEEVRARFPTIFAFCIQSLSVESRVDALRAASGVYSWFVDGSKHIFDENATVHLKDALLEGILQSRARFVERRKEDDDDSCHALSMAFSKVAEADSERIGRGRCANHAAMVDYAMEILAHPSRSSVARNVLDFFLCLQDIPTRERSPTINTQFFLRLLAQLVLSCEITEDDIPSSPEEDESGGDVLTYRSASDGPRDLFASIYGVLAERYVHELVAIIASSEFTFLRAEAALFALRCASKEICTAITRKEASTLQHQRLALLDLLGRFLQISFRQQVYFRSGLCATIADFSPVLHLLEMDFQNTGTFYRNGMSNNRPPSAVAMNLEYILRNLEDPAADALLENRACSSLLRLCSRHAKALAPFLSMIFSRVMNPNCRVMTLGVSGHDNNRSAYQLALENRRAVAEALSRLCAVHSDPANACRSVLEPMLERVKASQGNALELHTLAGLIKYFPPDTPKVVEVNLILVWPLLEHIFGTTNSSSESQLSENQIDAVCELVVAVFFCCSTAITPQALDQCLMFLKVCFARKPLPCLPVCSGKAIELFCGTILSKQMCTALILALVDRPERLIAEDALDCIPPILETLRRSFLFLPEAILGCEPRESAMICDFAFKNVLSAEREALREACFVVSDMVTRTRASVNKHDSNTRWNNYMQVFDTLAWESGVVANLAEHASRRLLHEKGSSTMEPLADLLYSLIRAYPSLRIPTWNGALEHGASISTSKEAFRQFVYDSINARAASSSVSA